MPADGATVLGAARVITSGRVHTPGWIAMEQGRVVEVGGGRPRSAARDLGPVTIVPGFVDLHCHGGNGSSFGDGADAATRALELHRRHGTTSTVASLMTDTLPALATQVRELAALVEADELVGVHLEGPWLSEAHCGAHDPALLRDPDPGELSRLLGSVPEVVVMVTLAPERPGGLESVRLLADRGILPALGHSAALLDEAEAAIAAGARVATHLFNASRPLHHREPGLVGAVLDSDEVTAELIADGVHVHPTALRLAVRQKPGRVALVTDATAATGAGDGEHGSGSRRVQVRDGVARVAGSDVLAGSVITLDVALRYAVQVIGVDLVDAVAAVTRTPADLLGRDDLGRLEPGARADLVVLDDGLRVREVMRRGAWVA